MGAFGSAPKGHIPFTVRAGERKREKWGKWEKGRVETTLQMELQRNGKKFEEKEGD